MAFERARVEGQADAHIAGAEAAVAGMVRLRGDRVRGLGQLWALLLGDLRTGQAFDFVVHQFPAVTN
ncbi:hypothetical protein [Streptomyces guryensis]|uniref:hypothetical protein n=1 Tax=Streptomyces guryensis TaxID=2886947 RepID=UPI003557A9D4